MNIAGDCRNDDDGDDENKNLKTSDHDDKTETTFRLIAIYDGDNNDEHQQRRRKRIAGHVLLRPLGRSSQWPFFSLNDDDDDDDDATNTWTIPSRRSNMILQESTLCEVHDKKKRDNYYACY